MSKLNEFQKIMTESNIKAYIVPTSDYHSSEYVSDYFKARAYLSGFTGSAGTLLILQNSAYLWTDGRYYIQAAKQLEGSGIELMKMGHPDYPTISQFLEKTLADEDVVGFDGKLLSVNFVKKLQSEITKKIKFETNTDIVSKVWEDRPNMPFSVLYKLDTFFSGKSYNEKLADILAKMKEYGSDMHILTQLEDQAWLYNLRGNDVLYTPVFLAFTIITPEHTTLYVDQTKIDLDIEKYLDSLGVIVKPYNEIYEALTHVKSKKILMDYEKANYQLYLNVAANNELINKPNPSLLLKSIKNETEIKNIRLAHIKDGVAVTKFMYHLKNGFKNGEALSEISLSDYMEKMRREQKGLIELSFSTICAYKDHGAMMHYSATKESNYEIDKDGGFLLIDSGGHYFEGTTDITRTYALGTPTEEMKLHFTTVLKSVIGLASAVFLKGCNGINLDILARGPIWKMLIDYKCGTGHGVGYLLSVHEAPNGIRWQIVPERNDSAKLVPGMITTDEPGIYLENKYGIRTENELLCVEKGKTEFGEFYGFETITYAPIDLDAINPELLTIDEKNWLNNYHKTVYDTVSPYLSEEEKDWLKEYTKEI